MKGLLIGTFTLVEFLVRFFTADVILTFTTLFRTLLNFMSIGLVSLSSIWVAVCGHYQFYGHVRIKPCMNAFFLPLLIILCSPVLRICLFLSTNLTITHNASTLYMRCSMIRCFRIMFDKIENKIINNIMSLAHVFYLWYFFPFFFFA